MKDPAYWITRLALKPHPEGGYYREVYRSEDSIKHPKNSQSRNLVTSIYFLLAGEDISHFHELASDELWYYHDGDGANIHVFKDGSYALHRLGKAEGQSLQVLLPATSQFAAEVIDKNGYVLMGCMVSPGFDFEDFRLLSKEEMLMNHSAHQELIAKFCID